MAEALTMSDALVATFKCYCDEESLGVLYCLWETGPSLVVSAPPSTTEGTASLLTDFSTRNPIGGCSSVLAAHGTETFDAATCPDDSACGVWLTKLPAESRLPDGGAPRFAEAQVHGAAESDSHDPECLKDGAANDVADESEDTAGLGFKAGDRLHHVIIAAPLRAEVVQKLLPPPYAVQLIAAPSDPGNVEKAHEGCGEVGDGAASDPHGTGSGTTTPVPLQISDLEALSLLFPALHNGHLFANATDFVEHCRGLHHALFCDQLPLICLQPGDVGTYLAPCRPAPAVCDGDLVDTGAEEVEVSCKSCSPERLVWLCLLHRTIDRALQEERPLPVGMAGHRGDHEDVQQAYRWWLSYHLADHISFCVTQRLGVHGQGLPAKVLRASPSRKIARRANASVELGEDSSALDPTPERPCEGADGEDRVAHSCSSTSPVCWSSAESVAPFLCREALAWWAAQRMPWGAGGKRPRADDAFHRNGVRTSMPPGSASPRSTDMETILLSLCNDHLVAAVVQECRALDMDMDPLASSPPPTASPMEEVGVESRCYSPSSVAPSITSSSLKCAGAATGRGSSSPDWASSQVGDDDGPHPERTLDGCGLGDQDGADRRHLDFLLLLLYVMDPSNTSR